MAEAPQPSPAPAPQPGHQTMVLTDPPQESEKHHVLLWSLCVLAVALVTGGIVAAYWSFPQQPEATLGELIRTYTNEQFGYSINYPESWSIKYETESGGMRFNTGNPDAFVMIIKYPYEEGIFETTLASAHELGYTDRQIQLDNSETAVLIEGESDKINILNLIYVNNSVGYELLAGVPKDFYKQHSDTLMEMVNSFTTFATTTSQEHKNLLDSDGRASPYSKDVMYVYYGGEVIPEADPKTFVVLTCGVGVGVGGDGCETYYAKDKDRAYVGSQLWEDVDVNTLSYVGGNVMKDANQVYYANNFNNPLCVACREADPQTFTWLGDGQYAGYFKDGKSVYAWMFPVEGVDIESFEVITGHASYDAEDKNHKYLYGEIVE